jgi:hypothetical protein
MSQKTSPQEIVKSMRALYSMPFCKNCEINLEAQKPYIKRTQITLTDLTEKLIAEVTKGTDIPASCYLCFALSRFFKLSPEEKLKELEKRTEQKD